MIQWTYRHDKNVVVKMIKRRRWLPWRNKSTWPKEWTWKWRVWWNRSRDWSRRRAKGIQWEDQRLTRTEHILSAAIHRSVEGLIFEFIRTVTRWKLWTDFGEELVSNWRYSCYVTSSPTGFFKAVAILWGRFEVWIWKHFHEQMKVLLGLIWLSLNSDFKEVLHSLKH